MQGRGVTDHCIAGEGPVGDGLGFFPELESWHRVQLTLRIPVNKFINVGPEGRAYKKKLRSAYKMKKRSRSQIGSQHAHRSY